MVLYANAASPSRGDYLLVSYLYFMTAIVVNVYISRVIVKLKVGSIF